MVWIVSSNTQVLLCKVKFFFFKINVPTLFHKYEFCSYHSYLR